MKYRLSFLQNFSGICQRNTEKFYQSIVKEKESIVEDILLFFTKKIVSQFPLTNCKSGATKILQFEPESWFFLILRSSETYLLSSWIKLKMDFLWSTEIRYCYLYRKKMSFHNVLICDIRFQVSNVVFTYTLFVWSVFKGIVLFFFLW